MVGILYVGGSIAIAIGIIGGCIILGEGMGASSFFGMSGGFLSQFLVGMLCLGVARILKILSQKETDSETVSEDFKEYRCPGCGAIVTKDDTVCSECKAEFYECGTCDTLILEDAKKCPNCGAELEEEEEEENKLTCKYCGAEIRKENNFCTKCGKKATD